MTTVNQLKIRKYVFRIYKHSNGIVSLYLDDNNIFDSDRHFMIEFMNEEEINKFIEFLSEIKE